MQTSVWWIPLALFIGVCLGYTLAALMFMAKSSDTEE